MRADEFFDRIEQEFPGVAEAAAEVDPPFILAANVYHLRTSLGLTQEQLAAAIGVSQPRIAEIERGDANPRLGTLAKLARALGVPVADLLAERSAGEDASDAPPAQAVRANDRG
jgi:transcriptional regulator with XRE-family HTH domain